MKSKEIILFFIIILIATQLSCFNSDAKSTLALSVIDIEPIIIYGDSRTNHNIHREIVNLIVNETPKVTFHTGDLVDDGSQSDEWNIFNDITAKLRKMAPFYPALGNHENNSQLYFDNFVLPNNEHWYSVEIDTIHFIILDSNFGISEDSKQYKWLENDLQNVNDEIKFIIIIFHHPLFSSGPHQEDEKGLRAILIPLFEEYNVDIIFNGHDHIYERSLYNGIYYIVSGGGGAPLYNQENYNAYSQLFIKTHHFCRLYIMNKQLFVDVIDINYNLIDQFKIEPKIR